MLQSFKDIALRLLPARLAEAWGRLQSPDEVRLLLATLGMGLVIGAILGALAPLLGG